MGGVYQSKIDIRFEQNPYKVEDYFLNDLALPLKIQVSNPRSQQASAAQKRAGAKISVKQRVAKNNSNAFLPG